MGLFLRKQDSILSSPWYGLFLRKPLLHQEIALNLNATRVSRICKRDSTVSAFSLGLRLRRSSAAEVSIWRHTSGS